MTIKRLKAPYDDYGIDSSGTVWSFKGGTKSKVKPRDDKDGYQRVNLADKGASKNGFKEVYIHKLVAKAFLQGSGHVLHKDGNRKNNKASNLKYGTIQENAKQRESDKRADSEDFVDTEDCDAPFWRIDAAVKATWRLTPEGYLEADRIVVAEAKVYEYADPNVPGGKRFELVTEEALTTLAITLVGKPITDEHPAHGKVDAATWRLLARGVVQRAWVETPETHDVPHALCVASAIITDKELIDKVLNDNIREVSPGYDATLARAPEGVTEYHFMQTARSGNHLAVTKAGRGGATSSIRLDSMGHATTTEDTMENEKNDAVEDLEQKLDAMQKKLDAAQAKVDAYEKAAEDAKKDKKDAMPPEDKEKDERTDSANFVKLYNERRGVEEVATRLGVKYEVNTTTADIKKQVVLGKFGADFRVDSVERIDAAFEAVEKLLPSPSHPQALADAFKRADSTFNRPTQDTANDDLFAAYDNKR